MDTKTVQASRQDIQVLDVREDDEWAAGRIDGAVHIPLGELDRRAGKAAEFLSGTGLSAEVMDGGMTQWAKDKLPFTTPDGRPGHLA